MRDSQWIKCSDSLPEEGVKVLVYDEEEISIDYIYYIPHPIWTCRSLKDLVQLKVKFWMSLPEAPNE